MKWEEVIKTPDYQKLSDTEKQQWRKEYFDDIVKPQIKADDYDSIWNEFNIDADRIEGIGSKSGTLPPVDVNKVMGYKDKSIDLLSDAIREYGPVKERKAAGFFDAMLKGRYNSTTAALTKSYLPETAAAKGIKQTEDEAWRPATRSERIGTSIGSIAADLPLYALGGAIGGPGGAFAHPAALKKMTEEKERLGGKIDLDDTADAGLNVLKEMPKEWIKGELLGLAGKTSGIVADKLGGGMLAKATGEAAALPVETAALLGADKVLNDRPITADTVLETLGTVGILKLSGSFPGAVKTAFNEAINKKMIPAEKLADNLKNETVKTMQDPAAGKEAIDRAVQIFEMQIKDELKPDIESISAVKYPANLQKALGESAEFGELNRNNAEYFGKDHLNDLMEFAVKTPDELSGIFEKSNFLEREFKQKGASPDLFLNKSRFIANKLGEKVYRNFVSPLRQAEHNFVIESQKYKDWIKENKKTFKSREREEIGEFLISQMDQGKATLNEMNITPKAYDELSGSQQQAVTEIRKVLDVMFERINAARSESGLQPLTKVDDYFTFLRKFSLLEELGYDPLSISKEKFESSEITDFKTRGLAFQFGKERIESTRALETDAYYVLDKYLSSAIRTTHMTPVIGRLRNALDFNDRLALTNPHAHKYLHDTLDYVSGKKLTEATGWINAVANKVNHNLGTFILTYNFHSIGVQPSAIVNTIGKLGPHAVSKGLKDFMGSDMRKFAMEKSKVLKARMHDVTIEEMTKGFTGKIGKVKSAAADFGTLPLRYLDLKTAQISWLAGFRYAKDQLKLTDREAVLFADDIVINSQGSASRIDLAPIQHTPLGKSLTLFNTFVINNLNFLTSDIMGITKANKLIAEGISKKQAGEYTADNQIARITGKNKYNVYERDTLHSTREGLEKLMTLAAAGFVCNSLYEIMGVKSPLPAPLSAAYEGFTGQSWVDALQGRQSSKKEDQLTGALKESMREFLSIIPVTGGSFRYGGDSAFGAVGGLVGETFDSIAEKPSSKPLAYIAAKWAGVPGGQQIYKILKQLDRERKEEEKEAKRALNPGDYIRRDLQKDNPYYQQKKEMKKQMTGY